MGWKGSNAARKGGSELLRSCGHGAQRAAPLHFCADDVVEAKRKENAEARSAGRFAEIFAFTR